MQDFHNLPAKLDKIKFVVLKHDAKFLCLFRLKTFILKLDAVELDA